MGKKGGKSGFGKETGVADVRADSFSGAVRPYGVFVSAEAAAEVFFFLPKSSSPQGKK
jgi:hypothetical protein